MKTYYVKANSMHDAITKFKAARKKEALKDKKKKDPKKATFAPFDDSAEEIAEVDAETTERNTDGCRTVFTILNRIVNAFEAYAANRTPATGKTLDETTIAFATPEWISAHPKSEPKQEKDADEWNCSVSHEDVGGDIGPLIDRLEKVAHTLGNDELEARANAICTSLNCDEKGEIATDPFADEEEENDPFAETAGPVEDSLDDCSSGTGKMKSLNPKTLRPVKGKKDSKKSIYKISRVK